MTIRVVRDQRRRCAMKSTLAEPSLATDVGPEQGGEGPDPALMTCTTRHWDVQGADVSCTRSGKTFRWKELRSRLSATRPGALAGIYA